MATKLFILVYAGAPSGDPKSPHASLYLESDCENGGTNFQLTGRHPLFRLERRDAYNPSTIANIREKILVGQIPSSGTKSDIRTAFVDTRIRNSLEDADWNCRNWVGDVLQRMISKNWVTKEERDKALDKMIDIFLDIEDEE